MTTATHDKPYYCPACEKDVNVIFDAEIRNVALLADAVYVIVKARCEDCGSVIRSGETWTEIS